MRVVEHWDRVQEELKNRSLWGHSILHAMNSSSTLHLGYFINKLHIDYIETLIWLLIAVEKEYFISLYNYSSSNIY